MNNKKLGTEFEKEVIGWLSDRGYWAHFIVPDNRGAQPFDIIAVKDNQPFVADCKTSSVNSFSISRLQNNQIFAFEKWLKCGNSEPYILVKYSDKIYAIGYRALKECKRIRLDEVWLWEINNKTY